MSVATLPDTRPADTGTDDDQAHTLCCSDDVALCGLDVSSSRWAARNDPDCPLCVMLSEAKAPCPVPGCPWGGGRLRRAWSRLRGYR